MGLINNFNLNRLCNIWFFITGFFFAGCFCNTPPREIFLGNLTPLSVAEQKDVYYKLKNSANQINSFRGLVSSIIVSGLRKDKSKQVVVFRRPSDLRLEILSPGFNKPQSLILVHDQEIKAINFQEAMAYQGPATAGNIAKLIHVPLKPDELALWMVGRFALPEEIELQEFKVFSVDLGYILNLDYLDGRNIVLRFAKNENDFVLTGLEIKTYSPSTKINQNIKSIFFSELIYQSNTSSPVLPSEILFWMNQEQIKAKAKFSQIEINSLNADTEKLFKIKFPEGIKIMDFAITDLER